MVVLQFVVALGDAFFHEHGDKCESVTEPQIMVSRGLVGGQENWPCKIYSPRTSSTQHLSDDRTQSHKPHIGMLQAEGIGTNLGVVHKVAGLEAVGEGYPCQVPKCQHKPKAIRGDVHGCQDCLLQPQRIQYVQAVESTDKQQRCCHIAQILHASISLAGSHAEGGLNKLTAAPQTDVESKCM